MIRLASQSWVDGWQQGPWDGDGFSVEWLRSRPILVQNLVLRFPPKCLVRANRVLSCPSPRTVGIVVGYGSPDSFHPEGSLTVVQSPDSDVEFRCRPGWLDVVGYFRGLNPSVISAIMIGNP